MKKKEKYGILFLDMDGVLATDKAYLAYEQDTMRPLDMMVAIDPLGLKLVDRLCKDYNLDIVVCSTWRNHEKWNVRSILRTHGFKANFHNQWKTPNKKTDIRGEEINAWLAQYGRNVNRYIILDDNTNFTSEQIANHLVKTDARDGFGWYSFLRAEKLLDSNIADYEHPDNQQDINDL